MKQNKDNTEQHKGAMQEGDRSNKAQCGITFTQALRSKQRRRRRNESGEKRIKGETGGET